MVTQEKRTYFVTETLEDKMIGSKSVFSLVFWIKMLISSIMKTAALLYRNQKSQQ